MQSIRWQYLSTERKSIFAVQNAMFVEVRRAPGARPSAMPAPAWIGRIS